VFSFGLNDAICHLPVDFIAKLRKAIGLTRAACFWWQHKSVASLKLEQGLRGRVGGGNGNPPQRRPNRPFYNAAAARDVT